MTPNRKKSSNRPRGLNFGKVPVPGGDSDIVTATPVFVSERIPSREAVLSHMFGEVFRSRPRNTIKASIDFRT